MENENWQANHKIGLGDKIEPDSEMNVGSEVELNPEIGVNNEMQPISSFDKQKQPKDKKRKKRAWMIVGIVVAIVVAFVLGSAVTVLVQNMTRSGDLEMPWLDDEEDREYILSSEMVLPEEFTELETMERLAGEGGYVFQDYEDFENKIQDRHDQIKLTDYDFTQHKYGLVTLSNGYCSGGDKMPVGMTVDGNVVTVRVVGETGCGACSMAYMNYLVEIDPEVEDPVIVIREDTIDGEDCGSHMSDMVVKPMIYLYPEEETEVSVRLGRPEMLTTTYPKYNEEWKVTAQPSGVLYDAAGREYYGLYWEGADGEAVMHEDGFIVAGEDAAEFLEEKLAVLGLSEREANEFIVYWLPKLEANSYNYIRFETREEIDEYMPLEVTPAPDVVIRVVMDYKPLEEPMEVKEQKLVSPERRGFTLVEWGGTEIGGGKVR